MWAFFATIWVFASMLTCTYPSNCEKPTKVVFGDNKDNTAYGLLDSWLNAAWFAGWIGFSLIGGVELIAFVLAISGVNTSFFAWWADVFGLWGTAFILSIPWGFGVIHISNVTGWNKETDSAAYVITVDMTLWALGILLHAFLIDGVKAWASYNRTRKKFDPKC